MRNYRIRNIFTQRTTQVKELNGTSTQSRDSTINDCNDKNNDRIDTSVNQADGSMTSVNFDIEWYVLTTKLNRTIVTV